MAASANRDAKRKAGDLYSYPGASGQHIYAGTLVQTNTSGYAYAGGNSTATQKFLGVAWDECNNTSSNSKITVSDGAVECRVYKSGTFNLKANGTPAMTDIGKVAYMVADDTVGVSYATALRCGNVVDYTSTTYWVRINKYVDSVSGVSGYWINEGTGSAY